VESINLGLPLLQIIGARGHIGIPRRPYVLEFVVEIDAAAEFL